jgi:hypothetical protein
MVNPHKHPTAKPIDFWLARGAVLVVAALQIGIVNDLTVGPRWLAPCLELALLVPLSVATAWTQKRARKASTDEQWNLVGRDRRMVRHLAIGLTAVTTLMNFGALARLIAAILVGNAGSGQTLLLDAINIWVTNVVIFALWFWALDRGGPAGDWFQSGRTIFYSRNSRPLIANNLLIGRLALSITCFWRSQTQRHFHPRTHFRSR